MKKLFALFALLACMATTYAQNSLVATLNHNDTIKVYYGANALKDAHTAAVDGDVITLSSGTFLATDITKGITLRGAGAWVDTVAKRMPTVIAGNFKIGTANKGITNLTIEGIFHDDVVRYLNSIVFPSFIKCRFKEIVEGGGQPDGLLINATVLHCFIASEIDLYGNSTIHFANSAINNAQNDDGGAMEFVNCIFGKLDGVYSQNSMYSNCVICQLNPQTSSSTAFGDSNIAYNCVNPNYVDGSNNLLFKNLPENGTNVYSTMEAVFKTYRGGDFAQQHPESFELTDSAKTAFLGTDGTQVGIYGGAFPFDPTVSVPQIIKFEVARQSTADGKLNVDIEVNAAAVEPKK